MPALTDDDEPVGHALPTRCHMNATPTLCLAPGAVLPAFQRAGAGAAAISAVLAATRRRGESVIVVLGHPGYHPRFGFERASSYDISVSGVVPDDALMVLSLDSRDVPPSGTIRYASPSGV